MASDVMAEQAAASEPLNPSERFFRYFQHEVTDLQEQMTRLEDTGTSGGERADAVDHCLAGIAKLSNEVKDASSYLPAYDQRTYSEAIKALSAKLQDVRAQFAPRQKFSFKNSFTTKKNASAISLNDAAELASQKRRQVPGYASSQDSSFATTPANLRSPAPEKVDEGTDSGYDGTEVGESDSLSVDAARVRMPSFSQSTSVSITNHDDIHIILPPSAGHATSSGTLFNLRRCVVDMSSPTSSGKAFAGLTLKNIKESLIICGHVSGAAHLTNVHNSVIVVASRQFRMHDSTKCDVYLHATSRPIIEDCTDIQFAPLPGVYATKEDDDTPNQWHNVDDFKWLRNEPSPNWSTLGSHRVSVDVWRDVVPGRPGIGVEDVLKAVNLPK